MKKKILIVFLFLLSFAYLEANKPRILKGKKIFKHSLGESYVKYNKKSTFKFNSVSNSLKIKSNVNRLGEVYFQVFSDFDDELIVYYDKRGKKNITKIKIGKGFNECSFSYNFRNTNEIYVKNISGEKVIFSDPIISIIRKKENKKYLFLISADTLAAKHMGIYGYKRNTTPNIKKFAKDSVLFNNAFANSAWTLSSHMSLFTSQYEYKHMVSRLEIYERNEQQKIVKTRNFTIPLDNSIPFLVENLSKEFISFSFNESGFLHPNFGFYRGFYSYNNIVMKDRSENLFR